MDKNCGFFIIGQLLDVSCFLFFFARTLYIDFFISDEQIDLEKQELFREGKSEGKHKIDRGSPASVGRLNNSERHITSRHVQIL